MNNEKTIILRSTELRNLRYSLRRAINKTKIGTCSFLMHQSMDIDSKIKKAKENNNKDAIKRLRSAAESLNDKAQALIRSFNKSICYCPICRKIEFDMKYCKLDESWYCINCFEDVNFNPEPNTVNLSLHQVEEFLARLSGFEGCQYNGYKARCGGKEFTYARRILNLMNISKVDQDLFLKFCKYYGGHCDCEILLNASKKLIDNSS